jgi:transposase
MKLKEIAITLQVSIATINRWMKNYNPEEQSTKGTPLPEAQKISKRELNKLHKEALKENHARQRNIDWQNRLDKSWNDSTIDKEFYNAVITA